MNIYCVPMQRQRGAMSSFPETLRVEPGSASSDTVPEQDSISLDSPSNRLLDYISLNSTNEEDQNLSMWNIGEPNSSSGPNQMNPGHIDPFGLSSDQFELDDHRGSHKRKASELSIGQSSSGVGSSNMFQTPDGGSSTLDSIREDPPFDPTIPRLGLSVGGVFSRQQDPLPSNNNVNNNRQTDIRSRSLPMAATPDNLQTHMSLPVMRTPVLRRNLQSTSRWVRSSSARAIRSANLDSTSDHPLFAQPSNESSDDVSGSRAGLSSGHDPSYRARRLSAYLRRSLLSAVTDLEAGEGQNSNIIPRIPSALSTSSSPPSQDIEIPLVVSIQDQHHRQQQSQSRSSVLLSRHLEGRGRLVSELRNVVDLMRRGEHIRFEDLMLLDQSVVYGIADIHDRHRDMRLDIDNMSYEELLALEERIGNVNTGLTEEKISKHLKQKQYVVETGWGAEPCCVCQEEYIDGDDLGALECNHEFHWGCIKQWLQKKNSCPICKSTGFTAT